MNTLLDTTMVLLASGEGMSRLFNLDMQLIADSVLSMIAIFVLFLALSYFLFNPVRKLLNDRKDKIRNELESAAGDMEAAKALREDYETRLREIDKEAESILGEARRKALANENQIIAQAKEEAALIMDRARKEAELEKQKAADEVKKEIISIASAMAGRVVSASMDMSVQESLIDETLKEMGDSTWLS